MNRRGFAKLLLGGVIGVAATPLLKAAAIADAVTSGTKKHVLSSFGWIENKKITWTELVTQTLREKAPLIRDNICANNALYDKLTKKTLLDVANDWQQDDIDRISAKLTERMYKKFY